MHSYSDKFYIPKNRNKEPYVPNVDSYLFGIDSNFFNKCSTKEIDTVKKYLMEIQEAVSFFGRLKYEKTNETDGVLLNSNCFVETLSTFRKGFEAFGGEN